MKHKANHSPTRFFCVWIAQDRIKISNEYPHH
jgi:hypothetical protein